MASHWPFAGGTPVFLSAAETVGPSVIKLPCLKWLPSQHGVCWRDFGLSWRLRDTILALADSRAVVMLVRVDQSEAVVVAKLVKAVVVSS
jgi:hypothetical protein